MEQHESESDIERFHEYMSARNIVRSRYWIISYCSFCAFVGFLLGLLISAEYIRRENFDNRALNGIGIVKANSDEYYKMERRQNIRK
jgi:hypothetical protein